MHIRLLIVDDEPLMIELLSRFLKPMASWIDSTDDIHPALEMARVGNYNVVLLDLRLKSTGKDEAFAAIKEFKRGKSSVVVVSGLPDPGLKEEAMMAGADAFCPKDGTFGQRAVLIATNIATLRLPHDSFHSESYIDHVKMLENMAEMPVGT